MLKNKKALKWTAAGLIAATFLFFGIYTVYWFEIAEAAKKTYVDEISKLADGADITEPDISGYPGKLTLRKDNENIESKRGSLRIENLSSTSWPFPGMPIDIETGAITLNSGQWLEGLSFDRFTARFRVTEELVTFEDSLLQQGGFEAQVTGTVDISDDQVAIPDLLVIVSNHEELLSVLVNSGIIEKQVAAFVGFGMNALINNETKKIEVPIYEKNGMINLGPLPIMKLPEPKSDEPPRRQKPVIPAPQPQDAQ